MRLRSIRLLTAGGLACTFLSGCRNAAQPGSHPTQKSPALAAGCNVLLITLDTTRADHLGCYGYRAAATPTLDALAEQGVRFDQAFTPAGLTLPAHTTLMTGVNPPEHGVRGNERHALGPGVPTLAEVFRQHGYRTAAFISSRVLESRYGLSRGFDNYDDRMDGNRRTAQRTTDAALLWLRQNEGASFFAWVHYYDAHWPYFMPDEFRASAREPYDGAIALIDTSISRMLSWLRDQHGLESTLVVVVADHGESLGEHKYEWHGLLIYDSILRVPLIFSLPGKLPRGVVHPGVVRMTDILPTILELLGWETPAAVSGESLGPVLAGRDLQSRASYAESDFGFEQFGWAKLRGLVESRWKYIRAPRVELYDRNADPGELHNLADAYPQEVARMEDELAAWEQRMPQRQSASVSEDAASLRALRALGYVGAPPTTTTTPDHELKDPKDMADIASDLRWAEVALGEGKPLETIRIMEPAARRSPESFVVVELLGKGYTNAGLPDLGQLLLQEALRLSSDSSYTWFLLAEVLAKRGAAEKAVEACERSLALDPHERQAIDLLPELKRAVAEQRSHLVEMRKQLQVEPASVELATSLAKELSVSGGMGEAVEVLKAALQKNPEQPNLANDLAWYLATTVNDALRDPAQALHLAQIAARGELADNPQVLDTLAAAQAANGDFDGAQATVQRAVKSAERRGDSVLPIALKRHLWYYETKRPYRGPE